MSEQNWHKEGDGLPPLNIKCECKISGEWQLVEIVAHHGCRAIFTSDSISTEYNSRAGGYFRPIKTERGKAIDQALAVFDANTQPNRTIPLDVLAGWLYDAGMLKSSE